MEIWITVARDIGTHPQEHSVILHSSKQTEHIKYPSCNSMAFLQSAVLIKLFLLFSFNTHSMGIVNRDLMAIDVNDILSEKLMPLSLIYVRESSVKHKPPDRMGARNQTLNHLNSPTDFNSAFNLMQFHRKMIQTYKCNKYIARQILTDIAPHTLHNRLGMANTNSTGNYEYDGEK